MKRSTLFLALAAIAMPMTARAQSSTATINISASVQSSVTITPVTGNTAISFGTAIAPGGSASVAPSGTNGYQSTIVANTPVTVAVNDGAATPSTSITLNGPSGGTLTVALNCATAATAGAATTTALSGCTGATGVGTTVLYVGGNIASVPAAAPAGSYTGSATVKYTWTTY